MPWQGKSRGPLHHEGSKGLEAALRQQSALSAYQVSELRCQTSIGGLFHVHHFRVRAQNVELPESVQRKT